MCGEEKLGLVYPHFHGNGKVLSVIFDTWKHIFRILLRSNQYVFTQMSGKNLYIGLNAL